MSESLFYQKRDSGTGVFPVNFAKFLRTPLFYRVSSVAALQLNCMNKCCGFSYLKKNSFLGFPVLYLGGKLIH